MARIGNESSHIQSGLTVQGGLEAGQITIGPNGIAATTIPTVFAPIGFQNWVYGTTSVGFSANQAKASRAIVPRDGTITDVAIFILVSSGNIDAGIYDASVTRNKLWSSGTTVVGGPNAWQTFQPNLAVFRGQALDIGVSPDNGTVTLAGTGTITNAGLSQFPAASWLPVYTDSAGQVAGATSARLNWNAANQFPFPATIAEGAMAQSTASPLVLCRLA